MLISGLIGAGIAGIFNGVGQIVSGQPWDWMSFGLSLAGGLTAGFISAIPPLKVFSVLETFGKALSWGWSFGMGGLGAVAGGWITGSVYSWETTAMAFAIGGFANITARGLSEKIAKFKASKIFNQGNKAKSLVVQQLQGHPLNMGSHALKGANRNAFKQVSQQEIFRLLINANPWLRYGIYSAIGSSALSGWF